MKLSRVGVDLNESLVRHRRLKRKNRFKTLLDNVEPGCEIGMEACAGGHYKARTLLT
jgi:transposase